MTMTVAALRDILAMLDGDIPVCIPGGELDLQDAGIAKVITVEWIDDPDDEDGPITDRRVLAIEP